MKLQYAALVYITAYLVVAHIPPADVACPANINSTSEIESWDRVNAVKTGCFVACSCFLRSSENGMKISGSVLKKGHSVYIVGQAI